MVELDDNPSDRDGAAGAEPAEAKRELRARLLRARSRRPADELASTAENIAQRVLELAEVQAASTVAAYASAGHEPGTWPLLDALHAAGVGILLPVLLPDLDLDWADYPTGGDWAVGRYGIREPVGARRGVAAIHRAEVVLCPGLAGDRLGNRLGKGGGSFDRALARTAPGVHKLLLLYDDEVLESVPATPDDQPVDVLVTPSRTIRSASATPR